MKRFFRYYTWCAVAGLYLLAVSQWKAVVTLYADREQIINTALSDHGVTDPGLIERIHADVNQKNPIPRTMIISPAINSVLCVMYALIAIYRTPRDT